MQYVEGLNGETARHSRVSTLAAEASWIMRAELLAVEIGQDRFNPAGDAKLAIDVVEVRLHGIGRDAQLIGDVFIAPPGCGVREDLPLTLGQ